MFVNEVLLLEPDVDDQPIPQHSNTSYEEVDDGHDGDDGCGGGGELGPVTGNHLKINTNIYDC